LRASSGVLAELVAAAAVLWIASTSPNLGPLGALVFLAAEGAITFLVHCPAHFFVGAVSGIRFSKMKVSRSTLASALPGRLKPLGRMLPILTLVIDRDSRASATPGRLRATYAAGALASMGSALLLAAYATLNLGSLSASAAWVFALAYTASDLVASPRTGDFARARRVASSTRA
jgi:hypothetical protein